MRKQAAMAALVLVAALTPLAPHPASARSGDLDPLRTWNDQALESVRLARASDADAARAYAMVNIGIYDAVNGIAVARGDKPRTSALRGPHGAPSHGDQQAAAVSAAHAVLVRLFPERATQLTEQLTKDLAMGREVAAEVLARRLLLKSGPTHVGECPR